MKTHDTGSQEWGATTGGEPVSLYTLRNSTGFQAQITDYGCRIVSLTTPNRSGDLIDAVLGFDNIGQYLGKNPHFGALTGRFAGRIAKGRFEIDGHVYQLPLNDSGNSIHGGPNALDRRVFRGRFVDTEQSPTLELRYISVDGDEGYPGNLDVTVIYSIRAQNELRIQYIATTDKPTILNLTNHSYFNLAGAGSGDVLGHVLTIPASRMAPTDPAQIPTGDLISVDGSPADFRSPAPVGARIGDDDEQLRIGRGYDVTYLLDRPDGNAPAFAARVVEPNSGLAMEVYTTQPAIQLYTASKLDGSIIGKGGKPYAQFGALCLETEHVPDAPNHPNFPSTVLRPGEEYRHETIYRFIA